MATFKEVLDDFLAGKKITIEDNPTRIWDIQNSNQVFSRAEIERTDWIVLSKEKKTSDDLDVGDVFIDLTNQEEFTLIEVYDIPTGNWEKRVLKSEDHRAYFRGTCRIEIVK